jgi:hypothetical protein
MMGFIVLSFDLMHRLHQVVYLFLARLVRLVLYKSDIEISIVTFRALYLTFNRDRNSAVLAARRDPSCSPPSSVW